MFDLLRRREFITLLGGAAVALLGATLFLAVIAPARAQQGDFNATQRRSQELRAAGNYPAALVEAQKLEALVKARFGTDRLEYARALDSLALVYEEQGKYADAEEAFKRALTIKEKALRKDHPEVALTLNNLAIVYMRLGKYDEAEELYKRALLIKEKAVGINHPDVAGTLDNLALVYQHQGRYAEAEALGKRALAIYEKALGPDHLEVARNLNNLAGLYRSQEKYAEALGLYKRSLAIKEKAIGPNHPSVAISLFSLAGAYMGQSRYAEAAPFAERALAIREKALGPDHPELADSLTSLAGVYWSQGKHADSERLGKRALAIKEKALGKDHPDVALTLNNLANVYRNQGKYADAEALYKRALAIREMTLGVNHPNVAATLSDFARMEADAHNIKGALDYVRKATAAVIAHAANEAPSAQQKSDSGGMLAQRAEYFLHHVAYLDAAVQDGIEPLPTATREAFEMAQWANHSSAAAAVQQMGLRFAAGSDALAALVRGGQDLSAFWRERDKALLAALSQPQSQQNLAAIDALRRELAETERKQSANAARLGREFPEYAALASPSPLKPEELQQLLDGDEALVFWLSAEQHWETHVFALTREGFEWKTIPLKGEALTEKVTAFRRGLDVDALRRGLQWVECTQAEAEKRGLSRIECDRIVLKECEEAEKRGLARSECSSQEGRRELFDLGLAHELYGTLIGLVEALIRHKRNLIVVPSGPLTALPFHLLVTEKPVVAVPQVKTPGDLAAYRDAAWLLKRHAVSVLPSVASLKALRVFARKEQGGKPLIGFGDPVFNAEEESRPAAEQTRVAATRSYTDYWKGQGADRAVLSKALQRLPETAAELQAVAKNLGAPQTSIHLRQAASEMTVKRSALADYRVVYFATHGLVAGEVKGLAEPSLALTLPKQSSDIDDGLLTASEVAQLKLNADWVVLSACNTIAGDKPGAKHCQGWLAPSSMLAPVRCSSRIGRWRAMRRCGSRHQHST